MAGCYEKHVFGFDTGRPEAPTLNRVFTLEAHLSAVKCLAAAGGFIASGGTDDLIRRVAAGRRASRRALTPAPPPRLFDSRRGIQDMGFLAHHEGSVTCLAFHPACAEAPPSHLLSGGADGELVIWSAGSRWEKLKVRLRSVCAQRSVSHCVARSP